MMRIDESGGFGVGCYTGEKFVNRRGRFRYVNDGEVGGHKRHVLSLIGPYCIFGRTSDTRVRPYMRAPFYDATF